MDGERGGEACGPEHHAAILVEPFGNGDHCFGRQPRVFGIAPVTRLAQAATRGHDLLAGDVTRVRRGDHLPREIDTPHERKPPQDAARARGSKRVLVVDTRPAHPHHDLAAAQCIEFKRLEAAGDGLPFLVDAKSAERRDGRHGRLTLGFGLWAGRKHFCEEVSPETGRSRGENKKAGHCPAFLGSTLPKA
jgi:hypothetical protein